MSTLLDLGCGAGGASVGYRRAGFEVTGVDILPQPDYPGEFIQADYLTFPLEGYDAYHLSAPCQRWSKQSRCRPELREQYPDHITPMRPRLVETGRPYVMENVEGSPLQNYTTLCGIMFGKEMYRHRWFEASCVLDQPYHPSHRVRASRAGHWEEGTYISVAGHFSPMWKAREVMDIGWMSREDMKESVPPYMTEYVGLQLRTALLLWG